MTTSEMQGSARVQDWLHVTQKGSLREDMNHSEADVQVQRGVDIHGVVISHISKIDP